jgi:hypothetical protein
MKSNKLARGEASVAWTSLVLMLVASVGYLAFVRSVRADNENTGAKCQQTNCNQCTASTNQSVGGNKICTSQKCPNSVAFQTCLWTGASGDSCNETNLQTQSCGSGGTSWTCNGPVGGTCSFQGNLCSCSQGGGTPYNCSANQTFAICNNP